MDNLHPAGVVTPPSLGGRESVLLPLAALLLLGVAVMVVEDLPGRAWWRV